MHKNLYPILLTLILFILQRDAVAQAPDKRIVYIGGGGIDNTLNIQLMNEVFGVSNWEQLSYGSIDTTDLFSTNTCFIFIEGSYAANEDFELFYSSYLSYFEDFVFNGGGLYINYRSYPSYEFYLGFDSIYRSNSISANSEGYILDVENPLFVGPFYPITNPVNFSPELGFAMCIGDFHGIDFDTLIIDTTYSRASLIKKQYGEGSIVASQFYYDIEYYSEEHLDLRRNILWHSAPCLHSGIDLGVQSITYPVAECNLAEEQLNILIHNYGNADQSVFQVNFQIDGGSIISELITETIPAYLSDTIVLTTLADLSLCGDHSVKIWTIIEGDTIPENDTLYFTINNICAPSANLNYPITICSTDAIFTPEINGGSGGIFEGAGVIDSLTGAFDPSVFNNGTEAVIQYEYATAIDYEISTIAYDPPVISSPINVSFEDNDDVDTLNIGFNFIYYENTYDTIFPASNGYLSFGEAHDTWYIGIPDETINNFIALAGNDLNILSGGSVYYETSGAAPYRKFVIKYDEMHLNFPFYLYVTVTAVLYETSGIVELYVDWLPEVDEGGIVQGIVNDDGTKWINTKNPEDIPFKQKSWFIGANDTAFRFTPILCPAIELDTIFIGPQILMSSTPAIGGDNNGTATASVTNGGVAPFSFLWETGATSPIITELAPEYYTVSVTDSLGCITTDSIQVGFEVGINPLKLNGLNIYPNPATNKIIIEDNTRLNQTFTISLINLEGIKALNQAYTNIGKQSVAVDQLPKGIYFIIIQMEDGQLFTSKLVLQ